MICLFIVLMIIVKVNFLNFLIFILLIFRCVRNCVFEYGLHEMKLSVKFTEKNTSKFPIVYIAFQTYSSFNGRGYLLLLFKYPVLHAINIPEKIAKITIKFRRKANKKRISELFFKTTYRSLHIFI